MFAHRMKAPRYKAVKPASGPIQRLVVKPEVIELDSDFPTIIHVQVLLTIVVFCILIQTAQVRPIGLAAVLRNITFTRVSTL